MGRGAELVEAERGDNQYKTIRKSGNSSPLSVALAGASSPIGEPFSAYTASGNQAFNDYFAVADLLGWKVTKPQAVIRPLTVDNMNYSDRQGGWLQNRKR